VAAATGDYEGTPGSLHHFNLIDSDFDPDEDADDDEISEMFSSPMTSSNKLGWPSVANPLKPEDYWVMSKKDDSDITSEIPFPPMPWSGKAQNLRKKNAAKLKASLAEEVVDLSG